MERENSKTMLKVNNQSDTDQNDKVNVNQNDKVNANQNNKVNVNQNNKVNVNPKYFNPQDFTDVEYIKDADLTSPDLDNNHVAKYCEMLIRSGVNDNKTLYTYLQHANLYYYDKTGSNLLIIAILSGNFTAIDVLLHLGFDYMIKNERYLSAYDLANSNKAHKSIKKIFRKYEIL